MWEERLPQGSYAWPPLPADDDRAKLALDVKVIMAPPCIFH
jgi:hypothetical protein